MKQQYNTALYLRLSRDDELKGESGSISTQRDMLTQYCREQNLNIIGEYVDDGWSGTNFYLLCIKFTTLNRKSQVLFEKK